MSDDLLDCDGPRCGACQGCRTSPPGACSSPRCGECLECRAYARVEAARAEGFRAGVEAVAGDVVAPLVDALSALGAHGAKRGDVHVAHLAQVAIRVSVTGLAKHRSGT